MATYTSNYGWTKPSGSDNVDISVLNDNLDDQDSTIHDAFLNMAPPFSESSTYAVDDIVLYDTGLYKCHTAVVTPGSWTGSTNWQVYKLSEGGGGGLTLGETSSTAYRGDRGKTAYDHSQTTGNPHGTTKSDVGLGNVPNVSTNDQTPTFTQASTRNNIASGEKLSVIFGKIQKFFNDLKTVAFSGSFTDLSNKPENANTFQGTIAEWNQLSTAEKKVYDHASIPDSIDGGVTFPANKVVLTGGGNVEDALNGVVVASVTSDGVKSISAIFNELYAQLLQLDLTSVGARLRLNYLNVWFYTSVTPYKYFTLLYGGNGMQSIYAELKSSGSVLVEHDVNSSGQLTVRDSSATVPASGIVYRIVKH